MSFHDLLSKDYRKSIFPELIRIIAVLGNIGVFFYLSGWVMMTELESANDNRGWLERLQYGPKVDKSHFEFYNDMEKDPFNYSRILNSSSHLNQTVRYDFVLGPIMYNSSVPWALSSLLDIVALGLAIYLTIKQFTFTRPEVDSFNEKIMLPAKEKSVAMLLFVFSCAKTIIQLFQDYPNGVKKVGYPTNPFGQNGRYRLPMNLCLVVSSAICVYSSRTFSFEMKMAEKRMTMRIVKLLTTVAFVIFIGFLLIVTFLNDNQCIFLVYMFFIIFDLFRIVTMLFNNSKKDRVIDIRDFLVTLKWVSFGILIAIISVPWLFTHFRPFELLEVNPNKGVYGWFSKIFSSNEIGSQQEGSWYLICKKNVFSILDYFTLLKQTGSGKGSQL